VGTAARDVQLAPTAMQARLNDVPAPLKEPMDRIRPTCFGIGRKRGAEDQHTALAHVGSGQEEPLKRGLITGVGDNQGVDLLVCTAGSGLYVSDLLKAMTAEP
jgi:hypothetical protein